MKKIDCVLASLLLVFISSCKQEDNLNLLTTSTEDAAREIGFVSLDISKNETRSLDDLEQADDEMSLGLVARIARKKNDCKNGFGLCDVRASNFMLASDFIETRSINISLDKYSCITECHIDSAGYGNALFILADKPEVQGLTAETMPPFCVDEDIEQPIEDAPQNILIVKAGTYGFNQSIGTYGGYSVDVVYKIHE